MFEKIFRVLLPNSCILCGKIGRQLCDECLRTKIQFVENHACHVCKKDSVDLVHLECLKHTNIDGVIIACKYSRFIEKLIAEVKYKFYTSFVDQIVELMLKSKFKEKILENTTLTYVPLHRKKEWFRGFNQTRLIASQIAKIQNIRIENLLSRKRNTKTQVGMTKLQRVENLNDVFEFVGKGILHNVVIVDDVMTSGTTLEECAKALKNAGVKKVYGFVLARG